MSENKQNFGTPGLLADINQRLRKLELNHWKGRHRVVMLDDLVQVLNLSSQSTLTWTDLDLSVYNEDGSGDISNETFAVILQTRVSDSGSASTNALVEFRKKGSSDTVGQFTTQAHHLNSTFNYEQGVVGLNDDQVCQYQITASGASTLTVRSWIAGYIEKLA